MKLVNFSDESVELANAALMLGFDIVKKTNVDTVYNGRPGVKTFTYLENCGEKYDITGLAHEPFPELNPTENEVDDDTWSVSMALTYIIHHKEINASMMNMESYQKQDKENVYRPMNGKDKDGNILIFDPKTLIDGRKAKFITNFSKTIVEKVYLAILKTRETDPEIGKNLFIYKESFSDSGKDIGKFGTYTELYSLWYKNDDTVGEDLTDFWAMIWDAIGLMM